MIDTGCWLSLHLKLFIKPYAGYKQISKIPGLVPETPGLHSQNLFISFKAVTMSS